MLKFSYGFSSDLAARPKCYLLKIPRLTQNMKLLQILLYFSNHLKAFYAPFCKNIGNNLLYLSERTKNVIHSLKIKISAVLQS